MTQLLNLKIWKPDSLPSDLFNRPQAGFSKETIKLRENINSIICDVRTIGDQALIKYTKEFDKISLSSKTLSVVNSEIRNAYRKVDDDQISALISMKKRVEKIEQLFLERINVVNEENGIRISRLFRPLQSVGCYVPGGEAAYPSTLIMTVVPAKIAGVPRIIVCSPPTCNGSIDPLTLVAADVCNIDEIYRIGGVQAIAAMAYGTESIKPVRKIVGPGNKYVTEAKLLVSDNVAIDMPAGPSEIVILADETANPKLVAFDMVAQAEHGSDSIVGLITTSLDLAESVIENIEKILPSISRRDFVLEAISNHGFIIFCETMNEAIDVSNEFAPEHLEIIAWISQEIAERIESAGLVLLGEFTPASASDYCLGTNHVLPTGGYSHTFSGLSVLDFVRTINFVECSKDALQRMSSDIDSLTKAENLPNHFLAVKERFNHGKSE